MGRGLVLGTLIIVGTTLTAAVQQQPAARAPLPEAQKVKENLYVIFGSNPTDRSMFTGGNTAIFVADSGVVLVDTKLAGYGPDILARVRRVTNKPVTTIINTHTHGDHTGSNGAFGATVDIVAHENTKTNMAKMDAFKGENAAFLPKRTYRDKLTIGAGKDRVDLYYFGAGHTSGDTWIVYPALRVLQTGDMFAWKDAPFVDRANGGSAAAFPNTIAQALGTIKDVDTIIPGHSPIATPRDLQQYQRYMADLVMTVRSAKVGGKTADEAVASVTAMTKKYPGYKTERVKAAVDALWGEIQ